MGKKRVQQAAAAAAVLLLVWLYGAIHVVYGEGLGVTTCWKVGWSYSDTFVLFENVSRFPELLQPKVQAAIDKCQIIPDAGAWSRDLILIPLIGFTVMVVAAKAVHRIRKGAE